MARAGSFGTSLNPFASSSGSSLGQYNVGDSIRDLEAYRAEVAWGNGTLTDEEYQASLTKLVAAASPGSTSLLSAQNKLDDVTYRIGRSKADAKGPDALIAFDQKALAGMNVGNLRYRDVKSSLDSELANRRSRDYGKIVDAYNLGKTSTESLMAWVQKTIKTLAADAPDKDNWASVQSSLTDRLVSEKDAKIYQDYQDRKMKPADFIAYLQGRRDAYAFSSPKYAEADRRLKDGQKNVKDAAQSVVDQDFANKYNNGKISDAQYLQYLNKRVDGMAADDPARPEWQQRLTQAAHSLAEDKLRTNLSLATTAGGQATAARNLSAFYKAYASTLNPGSAEYRATQVSIHTLLSYTGGGSSGGGGGGGGGGRSSGGGGGGGKKSTAADTGAAGIIGKMPKIISTANIDTFILLTTPNANSSKKAQGIAVAYLNGNNGRATDALSHGDKVWLFADPTKPGQMVAKQNPDGTPVLDAKGKPVMWPGSVYLPVSSNAVAAFDDATATYSYALMGVAAKKGDAKAYAVAFDHASTAENMSRNHRATAVIKDLAPRLDALQKGIDHFTSVNDAASVVNLLREQYNTIFPLIGNPYLSEAQQTSLEGKLQKVLDNPLSPEGETDMNGLDVPGGKQVGGWVDGANSPSTPSPDGGRNLVPGAAVMVQGAHYMLDASSASGEPKWDWKLDTGAADAWERDPQTGQLLHVAVRAGRDGVIVPGWATVTQAPIQPQISFVTSDGIQRTIMYGGKADYFSYQDDAGNTIGAYSIDGGTTWVQTNGGMSPMLQVNGDMTYTETTNSAGTVSAEITDANGNVVFQTSDTSDSRKWQTDITTSQIGDISWLGQYGDSSNGVGYPGQDFRIVSMDQTNAAAPSLNFIPNAILYASQLNPRTLENPSGTRQTFTRTLENPSGAQPNAPVSRFTRTLENPSGAAPAALFTRTLENPSGATASTYFDQGALASTSASWTAPMPGGGIISLGTGMAAVYRPPKELSPVYLPASIALAVKNTNQSAIDKLPTLASSSPLPASIALALKNTNQSAIDLAPYVAPKSVAPLPASIALAVKNTNQSAIDKAPVKAKVVDTRTPVAGKVIGPK